MSPASRVSYKSCTLLGWRALLGYDELYTFPRGVKVFSRGDLALPILQSFVIVSKCLFRSDSVRFHVFPPEIMYLKTFNLRKQRKYPDLAVEVLIYFFRCLGCPCARFVFLGSSCIYFGTIALLLTHVTSKFTIAPMGITVFTSLRTNLSPFTKGCRERDI